MMRVYQRTSFVDGFPPFPFCRTGHPVAIHLSKRANCAILPFTLSPSSLHVVSFSNRLLLFKGTSCPNSIRQCSESYAVSCPVASAPFSDKLIAFRVYERHDTTAHSLHHSNFITLFFVSLLGIPSFTSLFCSAVCLPNSFKLEQWRNNRQSYPMDWKRSFQAQRFLALLKSARAWLTRPIRVLFHCKTRIKGATNSCGGNNLVHCFSVAQCSRLSCCTCPVPEIEGVHLVCMEYK